ncbi:MAG: galactose-1-phosphate uridylyltransferase [Candidatus Eremiobacteraeota bacterium]|nr:galactose-1-phosphate uridylyltransferase [Candidatus Eremiobacteraeota bacterium]
MSELRWNPLLGEWLATATHRQSRTVDPPPEYCPLCPTLPGAHPTEVPTPSYDIVVFENRFPALSLHPPEPAVQPTSTSPVRPVFGACEVLLYTDRHDATLSEQPLEKFERIIRVWSDRYTELSAKQGVEYVFIFENHGDVVGATLTHPHGQIYAYPFIPPQIERETAALRRHRERTGRCLLCDLVAEELRDGRRLVGRSGDVVAFIPFAARWPYEVHVVPLQHVAALPILSQRGRRDLAKALKSLLVSYETLSEREFRDFPYIMAVHQRGVNQTDDDAHLHVEFYPFMRKEGQFKYLAGSELGAGLFVNDTLPEEKAPELRSHWPAVMLQ